MAQQRQSGSPRPGQKESNTPDNHAHDRLVFLFASFIVSPITSPTAGVEAHYCPGPEHYDHYEDRGKIHRHLLFLDS